MCSIMRTNSDSQKRTRPIKNHIVPTTRLGCLQIFYSLDKMETVRKPLFWLGHILKECEVALCFIMALSDYLFIFWRMGITRTTNTTIIISATEQGRIMWEGWHSFTRKTH